MEKEKKIIFKKIKKIEIKTRKLVEDYFSGKYKSIFKGTGMNFSDVREYYPGDDVRNIDWNVTARLGHPFVKEFSEEHEQTILIAVDVSGSGDFGTIDRTKTEIACEIASVLAFSALKNQDKIGLMMFSDGVEKYLPPKKSSQYVMRIIREILYYKRQSPKTDIEKTLKYINDVCRKPAVIFLISDFLDEGYEKQLRTLNRKHDLIAIKIQDPKESEIPDVGFIEIEDSETFERIIINTSDYIFRKKYKEMIEEREENLKTIFGKSGVDYVKLSTAESYIKPLYTFFKVREKRIRQ